MFSLPIYSSLGTTSIESVVFDLNKIARMLDSKLMLVSPVNSPFALIFPGFKLPLASISIALEFIFFSVLNTSEPEFLSIDKLIFCSAFALALTRFAATLNC
ncbi:MAG: hypothetical protein HRT47_09225 [Candidatus Caenarcaniphilales bacterium]|nr:hypothetical protein [Candidatus Caenarcaniphilales bacterium]